MLVYSDGHTDDTFILLFQSMGNTIIRLLGCVIIVLGCVGIGDRCLLFLEYMYKLLVISHFVIAMQ